MLALVPAAALIFAAAITPGPNNVIVMSAAVHGGWRGGGRAIAGVIAGSLVLLAFAAAGVAALIAADPRTRAALSILGAGYLIWTGGVMIVRAGAASGAPDRTLPRSVTGIAAFQLINPKAWLLVLAATTAAAAGGRGAAGLQPGPLFALAGVLVIVTGLCLAAWGLAGAALARWLTDPARRTLFDRLMGAALIVSAVPLLA